jgi:hypothetical protein
VLALCLHHHLHSSQVLSSTPPLSAVLADAPKQAVSCCTGMRDFIIRQGKPKIKLISDSRPVSLNYMNNTLNIKIWGGK